MDCRTFNSLMGTVNENWAAKVLGMRTNNNGPDLIDDKKIVEIKFKLIYLDKYTHICWRIIGYRLEYKTEKTSYWGLGTYTLNEPVSSIRTRDHNKLEDMVIERTLYIISWEWAKQFQLYHHKGKTKLSEWDYYMCFAKGSKLPPIISVRATEKGIVYLTESVNERDFNANP